MSKSAKVKVACKYGKEWPVSIAGSGQHEMERASKNYASEFE